MSFRLLSCLAVVGTAVASAPVQAAVPNLPSNTSIIAVVAAPAQSMQRLEAMAGRIGMAPPNAKAGWIEQHPMLAAFRGQIDYRRPIVVATTMPKLQPGMDPSAEVLALLPITPKANVEKLVAKLSGASKLASRREGGYLLIASQRSLLSKKARKRVLTAQDLASAKTLDIAVLSSPGALNGKDLEQAMGGLGADPEQAVAKALLRTLLEMSQESAAEGKMALMGLRFAKDGLRGLSRTTLNPKSDMARWTAAYKPTAAPLIQGHAAGPMMASLGFLSDADSALAFAQTVFRRTRARLTKEQTKTLKTMQAFLPMIAASLRSQDRMSLVARAGRGSGPTFVALLPHLDGKMLDMVEELKAYPADNKAKLPPYRQGQLDADTRIYVVDLGDRSLVAVGVARLDLADLITEAKKGTVPMKGDARYRTARAALPNKLVMEMYLDPGPMLGLALQSGQAAAFRPMAQLAGTLPPVAAGFTVQGSTVEGHMYVGDGVLGLAGMVAGMLMQERAQSSGRRGPSPRRGR